MFFLHDLGISEDTNPPVVSVCPSDQTFAIPAGTTTTHSFTWTPPTATDAAEIQSIVSDHPPGVVVSVDNPITVTYTVTDNNGLTNTGTVFLLLEASSKKVGIECFLVIRRRRKKEFG